MSKLSSIFKRSKKAENKVVFSGPYSVFGMLDSIHSNRKKRNEGLKLTNVMVYDMDMSERTPMRALVAHMAADAVAYVIAFDMTPQPEYYMTYSDFFVNCIVLELDHIIEEVNKGDNKIVAIIFNHESEEFKDPEAYHEDWIKKVSENHRVARFNVCSATDKLPEDAYDWICEQITSDIAARQAEKESNDKKATGFRWLAKLSKAALTFGTQSSS